MYPPRDYPETNHPPHAESDSVTLCSVKERANAKQPISDEMINAAVTNLFSVDSHEVFKPRTAKPNPQRSLRTLLKKPTK